MRKTFFESRASLALAFSLVAGSLVLSSPAAAQQRSDADIAQARALFNQGLDLREKGDVAGALEKLRTAHSLGATPITGLELGRTCVAVGRLIEAREVFLGIGRLRVTPRETARAAAARTTAAQLAEQLKGRIPKLLIKIAGVPLESVTVTIDGTSVPVDALTAPRPVDPGKHEIVATPTQGSSEHASVELKEGEQRDVEIHLKPADTAASAAPQPPPIAAKTIDAETATSAGAPTTNKNLFVYGGFGLAAAGVAVGTVTGLMAKSKKSSLDDQCRDTLTCPRNATVDDDLSSGRALGNVSTIAFAVAGAGAATGVIALIIGRKANTSPQAASAWVAPWAGPTGAGVSGLGRF
jgi:hypothetical protein